VNLFLLLKHQIFNYSIILLLPILIGCDHNNNDQTAMVETSITTINADYTESTSCPSIYDNTANKKPPTNKLQININFQPINTVTPIDYLADSGLKFDNRGNGYSYGWSDNISQGARDRNHNNAKDQRYDTLLHMLHPSLGYNEYWEIELPNNTYQVKLVTGDPKYCDKLYQIAVEDVLTINQAPNCSHFIENTANIEVTDGFLTIKTLPDSIDAKLAYIEITEVNELPDITPPSAVYNEKVTMMNKRLVVEWENPLFDYAGTLLLYDTKPIEFSPTQNVDCSNYETLRGAQFIVNSTSNRALLSLLKNQQTYYIKLFSFDESFNYSKAINLTARPHSISTQQEKEITENLMETLQAGNSPEVIYDTFSNFSKTHFGALITPQIYQKFGEELKIIEPSQWTHIQILCGSSMGN